MMRLNLPTHLPSTHWLPSRSLLLPEYLQNYPDYCRQGHISLLRVLAGLLKFLSSALAGLCVRRTLIPTDLPLCLPRLSLRLLAHSSPNLTSALLLLLTSASSLSLAGVAISSAKPSAASFTAALRLRAPPSSSVFTSRTVFDTPRARSSSSVFTSRTVFDTPRARSSRSDDSL